MQLMLSTVTGTSAHTPLKVCFSLIIYKVLEMKTVEILGYHSGEYEDECLPGCNNAL